jgi:hypothetical protein
MEQLIGGSTMTPVDKQIKWNERSGLLNCEEYQRQDLTELDTPPKLFMRRFLNGVSQEFIDKLLKEEGI